MGRISYNEISKAVIKPHHNVVISEKYYDGKSVGYAVSEQLVVSETENTETAVFLKNGLGVMSYEGLKQLRKAVDESIEAIINEKNVDIYDDELSK